MECDFSNNRTGNNEEVTVESHKIRYSEHFLYLSLINNNDGEIRDDLIHRIKVGWLCSSGEVRGIL